MTDRRGHVRLTTKPAPVPPVTCQFLAQRLEREGLPVGFPIRPEQPSDGAFADLLLDAVRTDASVITRIPAARSKCMQPLSGVLC